MAMFLSYNVISYNYKPVDLIISKLDIMCYVRSHCSKQRSSLANGAPSISRSYQYRAMSLLPYTIPAG
jgi:hypothetical protein